MNSVPILIRYITCACATYLNENSFYSNATQKNILVFGRTGYNLISFISGKIVNKDTPADLVCSVSPRNDCMFR